MAVGPLTLMASDCEPGAGIGVETGAAGPGVALSAPGTAPTGGAVGSGGIVLIALGAVAPAGTKIRTTVFPAPPRLEPVVPEGTSALPWLPPPEQPATIAAVAKATAVRSSRARRVRCMQRPNATR